MSTPSTTTSKSGGLVAQLDAAVGDEQRIADIEIGEDPHAAVNNADVVVTDCWVSMHQSGGNVSGIFQPYQVNEALMAEAKPDALFMHCLPAHRGEEVTGAVMDGPQSVVWDEAENRLHAQKGVLLWSLGA